MKYITTMLLVLVSYHSAAFANEGLSERQKVKCIVELHGGGKQVYFTKLPKNQRKNLSKRLINQKVYTRKGEPEKTIYSVHECVLENENFSDRTINRQLEKIKR